MLCCDNLGNGWPRVIARNGLHLLDAWPYQFTNTTQVYFRENPDPPQGGLYRYPSGRLRVTLPDGRERYLDIGNVREKYLGICAYDVGGFSHTFPPSSYQLAKSLRSILMVTSSTCPRTSSRLTAVRSGTKRPLICFRTQ